MKKLLCIALGFAFLLSVQSCFDEGKGKYMNEKTLVDDGGIALIQNGIEGGLTEIKASTLAEQKSTDPQVISFAKMMITDHAKADSELYWMEKDKLITEKDTISGEHQEKIDSLSAKTGTAFDKAYAAMMVKDHEEAVALFEGQTNNKNQTIQDFARATLPTLKMHLSKAKDLAASFK